MALAGAITTRVTVLTDTIRLTASAIGRRRYIHAQRAEISADITPDQQAAESVTTTVSIVRDSSSMDAPAS